MLYILYIIILMAIYYSYNKDELNREPFAAKKLKLKKLKPKQINKAFNKAGKELKPKKINKAFKKAGNKMKKGLNKGFNKMKDGVLGGLNKFKKYAIIGCVILCIVFLVMLLPYLSMVTAPIVLLFKGLSSLFSKKTPTK